MNFLKYAFFQGQFVPFVNANISIATQCFQYGTGAFGGMRGTVKDGKTLLFRVSDHAKRLSNSAKFLNFEISPEQISSKILEFVKINKSTKDFYIRPMVYVSDLGIAPKLYDCKKDFLIYGLELGNYLNPKGVSCRFSSWVRQEDRSTPLRAKISGSYVMSSMAKTEAVASGFDEALIFNTQGKICEASAMNIFIVRNNVIYTPSTDQDILEGITRDSVIQIAKYLGYQVIERPIDKTEILIADEVFLTGTAGKVTPVYKIENYNLPEFQPITDQIQQKFISIIEGNDSDFAHWITIV